MSDTIASSPTAPIAPKRTVTNTAHGETWTDDWAWIRNREDPATIGHLTAENGYADEALAHLRPLRDRIVQEIKARTKETDLSVPVRQGEWEYLRQTEEGKSYSALLRRRVGVVPTVNQVVLDSNVEAEGHEFFDLGETAVDNAQHRLAYTVDTAGNEHFALHIRDIASGTDLPEVIENVAEGLAWSFEGDVVFYARREEGTDRQHQIWRHELGTDPSVDALVFEETDPQFYATVEPTKSKRFIAIGSGSTDTSELRLLASDDPTGVPTLVEARRNGVRYDVEHDIVRDRLIIHTDADAPNWRVMAAPMTDWSSAAWTELVPARADTLVEGVELFRDFLVLQERGNAETNIRVIRLSDGTERVLAKLDTVSTIGVGANPEFDSPTLRFAYTSPRTPTMIFDEDLASGDRTLRKQQEVPSGFDPDEYVTTRLWATAGDGTKVPMSIVHHVDTPLDGTAPAVLYGYGSYGHSEDPSFGVNYLSLLDRGFVWIDAHIRGGSDMGRQWYYDGRLDKKMNTFTDFIACAEHAIAQGYTNADRLVSYGGSAGGLLVGATANLRPDLFAGVVASVPFVDALNTMLDPTLPLTTFEYTEWGNPTTDPTAFAYIRSYAPYENVRDAAYPAFFVRAGLNDPRVGYWEPAKWVQKLREHTTSGRPIILRTEMGAGHQGPSGRYNAWETAAETYAAMVDMVEAVCHVNELHPSRTSPAATAGNTVTDDGGLDL